MKLISPKICLNITAPKMEYAFLLLYITLVSPFLNPNIMLNQSIIISSIIAILIGLILLNSVKLLRSVILDILKNPTVL